MRHRRQIILVVLSIPVLAWLLILALNWHSRLYRVTVLPEFRLRLVQTCGLNDRGQIVGYCAGRFLLWERGTGWRELARTSRSDNPAYYEYLGINNAGQVAGTMYEPNDVSKAFLWDPNEGMVTLGTGMSAARGLNNRGQIIGQCWDTPGKDSTFSWHKAQGMRIVKGANGLPIAMNDAGQIMGNRGVRTQGREVTQRVLWELADDGTVTETPLPSGCVGSLNNNGYVPGQEFNFDQRRLYVFIWRKGHDIEWLFPIESQIARVAALNDTNMVAVCEEEHSGWLERLTGRHLGPSRESFVWTRERGRVFLDRYVVQRRGEYLEICDMNNHGCIIGTVGLPGRSQGARAVLLEPIAKRWRK
jgi:probable HAF family extracellular repeat protein